jgi:pyrimidine 5'-nucleotidase
VQYTTIFFDLDDTLYSPDTGIWSAIRERMNQYMLLRMKLDPDLVPVLRRQYYEQYGTTLRGLQINYHVDSDDFLDYVHDLPIDQIIQPDPALRRLLLSLPQQRFIFTNADTSHAGRVLRALGVQDCFQDVIDLRTMNYYCKPNQAAYQTALACANTTDPRSCVYLDDSPRNLYPAHAMGFHTILVGNYAQDPSARQVISSLHDLPQAMPELWLQAE